MQRIVGGAPLPPELRGGVAALGNFDGYHFGHQAVVGRAMERARERGVPALVVTFDPHPARLFRPERPPFALTTIEQRLDLIEADGVDGTVVLPFDHALAAIEPEAFARDWLVKGFGLSGAVSGEDFTFGRRAAGDTADLARFGAAFGFTAEAVGAVRGPRGGMISSTRIREALRSGDPKEAARLLTRPFAIRGTVEHGDKRGRTIGVPTANLALGPYLRPAFGVYAVRVRLPDGRLADAVANLGVRPMFEPPRELLEVFIFDFRGDLYEQEIEVQLIEFLRPEWKLDGLEALKAQIAEDVRQARAVLA